jgi:hypothetical protein
VGKTVDGAALEVATPWRVKQTKNHDQLTRTTSKANIET